MPWRANEKPTPGWKGRGEATALQNPRPPAVPGTLRLTLAEYFAAAATIGILSAQEEEPDRAWLEEWALDYGYEMAEKAEQRRQGRRRR